MKTDGAKKYLERLEELDEKIKNKLDQKQRWQDIAMNTTARFDGCERVQSSGNQQKMESAVVEYVNLEFDDQYTQEIAILQKQYDDIIQTIEQLNLNEYKVLYKYYAQYKSFEDIGLECKRSRSWATSMHGTALISLQKILDERKNNDK